MLKYKWMILVSIAIVSMFILALVDTRIMPLSAVIIGDVCLYLNYKEGKLDKKNLFYWLRLSHWFFV